MSSEPAAPRTGWHAALADAALIVGWFALLAVIGAVVWWQLVELPRITSIGGQAVYLPGDLVHQVGIDGWYAVIAQVGGLLSGITLSAWRRRDPLLTVALCTAAAGGAAWLMLTLGRWLGPDDPSGAVRSLGENDTLPVQLVLHAGGVAWLWPLAAALGCLVWLWTSANPERSAASAG